MDDIRGHPGTDTASIGKTGLSLISNERMWRFWTEYDEGHYQDTRHRWRKVWAKDVLEM